MYTSKSLPSFSPHVCVRPKCPTFLFFSKCAIVCFTLGQLHLLLDANSQLQRLPRRRVGVLAISIAVHYELALLVVVVALVSIVRSLVPGVVVPSVELPSTRPDRVSLRYFMRRVCFMNNTLHRGLFGTLH